MEPEVQESLVKTYLSEPEYDYEVYKVGRKKVIILGFNFMILFSAFNSAQNLVGSLFSSQGYSNLGIISLLVIYSTFAIFSLFTNFFISRVSYKAIFVVGSFGYATFTGSGIWICACDGSTNGLCSKEIVYLVVLLGSFLCGLSSSLIWVAQGGYIASVAIDTPQRIGMFSGVFWAIMQGSQVFGAVLGTFILQYLQNMSYFLIMTALCLASCFLFLAQPYVKKIEPSGENILPMKTQVKNVFRLMVHEKTRYVLLLMMLGGIIVSFYSGFLSNLVENSVEAHNPDENENKEEISRKLSFTLLCLGFFEVFAGLIAGRVCDRFNVYKLASFATLVCLLGVLFSFLGLFTHNYLVCFIVASIWGFCDCFTQSVIQTLFNKDFVGQIEIYQVFQFVQAAGAALFFVLNILLEDSPPYIYILILMFYLMMTNFSCSQLGKNTSQESTTSN